MNGEVQYVRRQTELERKSIAASARKRKTHNGKGGCKLPHESMSKKEMLKMNGEVQSVNVNEKLSYKEFKALPSSLQETYLWSLVQKYDVSGGDLQKLFGLKSSGTISTFMKKNHPNFKLGKGGFSKDKQKREAWKEFLNSDLVEKTEPVDETVKDDNRLFFDPLTAMYYPASEQAVHDAATTAKTRFGMGGWKTLQDWYDELTKSFDPDQRVAVPTEYTRMEDDLRQNRVSLQMRSIIDKQFVLDVMNRVVGEGVYGELKLEFTPITVKKG